MRIAGVIHPNPELDSMQEIRAMSTDKPPQFFYEIFHPSLPRHGPGDDAATGKALTELLKARPEWSDASAMKSLRILDLGCGVGPQTIQLAKLTGAHIIAVDNHQAFLDELMRRAQAAGVADQIEPRRMDMNELTFDDASFDLIWSEGAIFATGFEKGMTIFRRLLKPGGLAAVTELVWFVPAPPPECKAFFDAEYPPMTGIPANLAMIESAGLRPVGHFNLPAFAWSVNFYDPLNERLRTMRNTHRDDSEKMALIEMIQREIDMNRTFPDAYGYTFFLMQST
jgi:SAM-dependent methyltransferase